MTVAFRNLTTTTIRFAAELALTAGFVLLLFAFYLLVWTGHRTANAQEGLLSDFRESTSEGSPQLASGKPDPGDGVAVLHIPRFGKDWEWVVVEGTAEEDLRNGPGRFSNSAMPGKVGNFAVAGHRATHGEPFARLDEVKVGDRIVVETAKKWLVYEVSWSRIVSPSQVSVVEPVSGHPGKKPTQRMMTLVTCNPRWGSTERLVIGTQLVERRSADAGPPDDIA